MNLWDIKTFLVKPGKTVGDYHVFARAFQI